MGVGIFLRVVGRYTQGEGVDILGGGGGGGVSILACSGGHRSHVYCWYAGDTDPTGMLSCLLKVFQIHHHFSKV